MLSVIVANEAVKGNKKSNNTIKQPKLYSFQFITSYKLTNLKYLFSFVSGFKQ